MNPLTNVRNITKLNERELTLGIESKNSWHNMYSSSAWIFVGGLNYDLSEGDVITVFSQYGEVVHINLIRDQKSGKSKGFCFLCYEDQRSTVLAVDNLNAIKLLNRIIRVDHVMEYKVPKEHEDMDEVTKRLQADGCAPQEVLIAPEDTKPVLQINSNVKHKKKERKSKHRRSSSSDSNSSSSSSADRRQKRNKSDSKRMDKREDKSHKRLNSYERDSHKKDSKQRRHKKESKYREQESEPQRIPKRTESKSRHSDRH